MIEKNEAKYLRLYFILSYIFFWLLLALTGLMISLEVPLLLQNIMKNICAWTPTFVVLIMFNKLYPDITLKEYLRLNFGKKIKPGMFLLSFLLQVVLVIIAVFSFFLINNRSLNEMSFIAVSSIIPVLILDLTGGALGEELGWRGYALNSLQRKYRPLTASLILGVIWGFWHLPLMILSGYSGMELIFYIAAFMVGITSFSVVITFFYNKTKNILIAMWMHFLFNFLLKIVIMDILDLLISISIAYLVFAVLVTIFNTNKMLIKRE